MTIFSMAGALVQKLACYLLRENLSRAIFVSVNYLSSALIKEKIAIYTTKGNLSRKNLSRRTCWCVQSTSFP